PRLIDQLKAALPATIRDLAQAWQSGPPAAEENLRYEPEIEDYQPRPSRPSTSYVPPPQPRPSRPQFTDDEDDRRPLPAVDVEKLTRARQQLLTEISRVFTSDPAEQARIMTEIETDLLGIPDEVIVRVLAD